MLRLILMVLCIGMGSPVEGARGENASLIGAGGALMIGSPLLLATSPFAWIGIGAGLVTLMKGLHGKYKKIKKS